MMMMSINGNEQELPKVSQQSQTVLGMAVSSTRVHLILDAILDFSTIHQTFTLYVYGVGFNFVPFHNYSSH